ncbi:aminotransferase class V-fold PLP-dependent enzyme [Nocardioides carbamazepini]|uniref:pyridoxal phosphate-dependent decarboxylase family protein n=1 Tax=Nocardioides carbamazepini TaxID=2854259 RepID=UPI00214A7362|nr:aminotransferase class V-fold PLP-dependent enzyme [Nocardioides carbamazepini]MCR1781319.1 aminotransferase class V-fold PLP-dependent enzyme [Nocardioides carbamazepini]
MLNALYDQVPPVRQGRFGMFSLRGNDEIQEAARRGYERFFSINGLFARVLPSLKLMHDELLAAWASELHTTADCGVLTSGGSDSIFNAVHSIREWARERHGDEADVEIVAPFSAHAAFTKACHFLGVRLVRVPLTGEYRVDLAAMEAAITDRTAALIASAPSWPHGVYDPIAAVGALARERDLWLHVDACVGGCMTPFVRDLGYPVPAFAFDVEGVSSVSLDLHKYGYAPKPCSALFYASPDLRRFQGFSTEDWSNGLYRTDAFVGSRPAGAISGAWAVLRHLGRDGYLRTAQRTMAVRDRVIAAVEQIPELHVVGSEMSLVAIGAAELDITEIGQGLSGRGWSVFGVAHPPLIHLTCDAVDDELVDEFLADLVAVTADVSQGVAVADGDISYT